MRTLHLHAAAAVHAPAPILAGRKRVNYLCTRPYTPGAATLVSLKAASRFRGVEGPRQSDDLNTSRLAAEAGPSRPGVLDRRVGLRATRPGRERSTLGLHSLGALPPAGDDRAPIAARGCTQRTEDAIEQSLPDARDGSAATRTGDRSAGRQVGGRAGLVGYHGVTIRKRDWATRLSLRSQAHSDRLRPESAVGDFLRRANLPDGDP